MIETLKDWRDCLHSAATIAADWPVRFDHGPGVGPVDSWRGDYAQVTLPWLDEGEYLTASELLRDVDAVIDGQRVLIGYKGGEYHHNNGGRAYLYADDHGRCEWRRAFCLVGGADEWIVATDPVHWISRVRRHHYQGRPHDAERRRADTVSMWRTIRTFPHTDEPYYRDDSDGCELDLAIDRLGGIRLTIATTALTDDGRTVVLDREQAAELARLLVSDETAGA